MCESFFGGCELREGWEAVGAVGVREREGGGIWW